MKAFLFIGHTGRGKSKAIKDFIKDLKCPKYVYDINKEYENILMPSLDIDEFTEKVQNKKNSIIIFEEATIFFSNKGRNKLIINLLVRKRHTKNIIILVFHSLRTVPINILELIDYIHLFATNDNPKLIEEKFSQYPAIINQYFDIKNKSLKNFHYNRLFKNRV